MGRFVLPRVLELLGWLATSIMFAAAMGFSTTFVYFLHQVINLLKWNEGSLTWPRAAA
jgi:hypothetical protein